MQDYAQQLSTGFNQQIFLHRLYLFAPLVLILARKQISVTQTWPPVSINEIFVQDQNINI